MPPPGKFFVNHCIFFPARIFPAQKNNTHRVRRIGFCGRSGK